MLTKSLTFKVFINTLSMLFLTFVITYGTLYFLLPQAYKNYVISSVTEVRDSLLHSFNSDDASLDKIAAELNQLDYTSAVDVAIFNDQGQKIYPSNSLSNSLKLLLEPENQDNILETGGDFTYNGRTYTLKVYAKLSSVEDVKASILNLIPLMMFIILIISVLTSFLYTNIIVNPILVLNKKAYELSKLNFDNNISIDVEDELGQLSDSLDSMSMKLKDALLELETDVRTAENRERERRNYMSMMSHELKTPLTIIKGQSECMLNDIGVYKDHTKYLGENINIISDIQGLVDQILLSAKLDDIDIVLDMQKSEIKSVVELILEQFALLIQEKELSIKLNLELTYVMVDMKVFRLGLKNMIENAIKYTNEGGGIVITLKDYIFEVKNQAPNASELDFKSLVKPFERGDSSRNTQTGGHGLGLYILKRSFEIHNFNFTITNEDDIVSVKLIMEDIK